MSFDYFSDNLPGWSKVVQHYKEDLQAFPAESVWLCSEDPDTISPEDLLAYKQEHLQSKYEAICTSMCVIVRKTKTSAIVFTIEPANPRWHLCYAKLLTANLMSICLQIDIEITGMQTPNRKCAIKAPLYFIYDFTTSQLLEP